MSQSLQCVCGFQGRSARSLSTHTKKCKIYEEEMERDMRDYQEIVKGTPEDLRDFKRRHLDPLNGGNTNHHELHQPLPDSDGIPDMAITVSDSAISENPLENLAARPQRQRRLPLRFRDEVPEPEPTMVQPPIPPRVVLHVTQPWDTPPNKYGLFRRYPSQPTYIPGEDNSTHNPESMTQPPEFSKYHPFPNFSQYQLASWFVTARSGTVSGPLFDSLLRTLRDPRFDLDEISNLTHRKALGYFNSIGDPAKDHVPWLSVTDCWHSDRTIPISIPGRKVSVQTPTPTPRIVNIGGLHYRAIMQIIQQVYSTAKDMHYMPFELFHQTPTIPERVYGEIFTSPAWIEEHRRLPYIPGCSLERVVAPLMFWSDATHLTSFGTAKLWPIYMSFGSQSKYTRIMPTSHQIHHVAYIPSLPDSVQDVIREFLGEKSIPVSLLTHCRRELMHGMWSVLLDEDFTNAYQKGVIICCPDQIQRRIFPRIFTYSADYPEKVLLATIRDKGKAPCPRCLIAKEDIPAMGTARDLKYRLSHMRRDTSSRQYLVTKARDLIYQKGVSLNSVKVERLLKPHSLVPTSNAFSTKLAPLGFDFHRMLVVDFLHEVELGVWKTLFTHFVRILYMEGEHRVQELNKRYRLTPTFGRDTIRRFSNNVAEMKKLAARDFEDILQCAIPAFEGLLPEPLDTMVQDLLYVFSLWHGVCKLRMHTQATVQFLRLLTQDVGKTIRQLQMTTQDMQILELPREVSARMRRQSAEAQKASNSRAVSTQARTKNLNIITYKFHAMGDYAHIIPLMGSVESFSTQAGELQHRTVKRRYHRASKAQVVKSLTTIETQERHNLAIQEHAEPNHTIPNVAEYLPYVPPSQHYYISTSKKSPVPISKFLRENKDDIAITNFTKQLKNHILGRIMGLEYNGDETEFTADDRSHLFFKHDTIYAHKTCRINFTTYDLRRSQDVLNPGNGHSDIMVLSREDQSLPHSHRFWYARVIGIFHVEASHKLPSGQYTPYAPISFLWVRWFGKDYSFRSGIKRRRMDRLTFITEEDDTEPFGFLDPSLVLRAVHLLPAFPYGYMEESALSTSKLCHPSLREPKDWRYYFVNLFADRDMLMRYIGGGIGHTTLSVSTTLINDGTGESGSNEDSVNANETMGEEYENNEHIDSNDGDDGDDGNNDTDDESNTDPDDDSEIESTHNSGSDETESMVDDGYGSA